MSLVDLVNSIIGPLFWLSQWKSVQCGKGFSNKYSRLIAIKSFIINTASVMNWCCSIINEMSLSKVINQILNIKTDVRPISERRAIRQSICIYSFFWSTYLLELNTRHHEALSLYEIQSSKSPNSCHRPFFQSDIISYYYFPIFVFRLEVKDRKNWQWM